MKIHNMKIIVYAWIRRIVFILLFILSPIMVEAAGCCQVNGSSGPISAIMTEDDITCDQKNTESSVAVFMPDKVVDKTGINCIDKTTETNSSLPIISNPFDAPNLSVSIPGFTSFGKTTCTNSECISPWLASYIDGLYRYGTGAIAILAIITMMIAGVIWITAGGKEERIADAKQWIGGSLMGLLIALSSFMILNIINPALTVLSPIKIAYIGAFDLLPQEPGVGEDPDPQTQSNTPGSYPSVGGSCFPVAGNSYSRSTWGFGDKRVNKNGRHRCHAGVDLYTKGSGYSVAMAAGTVLSTGHFYNCSGGAVSAVIIDHGDYVANYGEIDTGKVKVSVGQQVKAGDILGVATRCGMLHFELYTKGTKGNEQWYPPSGKTINGKNYCRDNYMSTKPQNLMDPTNTLKSLESKLCGN